jgi:transcriptional regulator GlxA family with amidase domain
MAQRQQTMKKGQSQPKAGGTVAVVAFEGISPFHLSVPCAVFGVDRSDVGVPRFDVKVCAKTRGRLTTAADFDIVVHHGYGVIEQAWLVIVPSWKDADEPVDPALRKALVRAHRRGATVAGLCLGAFALAGAGLLDGREATTHWLASAELGVRYPRVRVRPDVLYLDEDGVVTAAGTAAGLDCCIYLLRQRCGAEVASCVARRMVVSPYRQGGQAQYIEMPLGPASSQDAFAEVLAKTAKSLDRPHSLSSMAEKAHMSRRNFTRRFREVTGTTPARWVVNQRLVLAQRLLETKTFSVELIAEKVGFRSAVTLRQQFVRAFGVSPRDWQKRFRGSFK